MRKNSDFVDYLLELYRPMQGVSARRMFGGHGIFKDGLMFALVSQDELFLKGDDLLRAEFEKRGLAKFTYRKEGKDFSLSYYQAPAECLDESSLLVEWSAKSLQAARRVQFGRKRRRGAPKRAALL